MPLCQSVKNIYVPENKTKKTKQKKDENLKPNVFLYCFL